MKSSDKFILGTITSFAVASVFVACPSQAETPHPAVTAPHAISNPTTIGSQKGGGGTNGSSSAGSMHAGKHGGQGTHGTTPVNTIKNDLTGTKQTTTMTTSTNGTATTGSK